MVPSLEGGAPDRSAGKGGLERSKNVCSKKEVALFHFRKISIKKEKIMTKEVDIKKYLTVSNLITAILVAFVLAMLIKPDFKGYVIQNLMKVGLFQPKVPESIGTALIETESSLENEDILFKSIDGKVVDLKDQKGKVVFINFWATWCPPCVAEMPAIQKLYTHFKGDDRVLFLLVDVDNKPDKSQKFMDKRKFDLPVYTPESTIPSILLTGAIPTTVVLNKNRKIVFRHEGTADYSNNEFVNYIKELAEQ
jgi:thiol-disulfide isomerase/thioredoxin